MRPLYHYAPAANWLSDPNGLVFANGEWHLFYQYNPHGEQWGHMAWGHAVSRDLATWEELPPALLEDDEHFIFSGSAVVDEDGAAGFGKGALVAAYTGAAHNGSRQVQCLAHSDDDGRTWTKYADNPVLDEGLADFRDPNVFWHEPSAKWIMVVALSAENLAAVYGSANLRQWTRLSTIGPHHGQGRLWECPLLIELPVEGEAASRWLFKVDLLDDGPGSGAIGVIGSFDGVTFVAQGEWRLLDHGRDFYAAIAWHEPRDSAGRPAWIGWMGHHGYQAALPTRGWRGAMSLPRRLSLVRDDAGALQLRQEVEPAVAGLFSQTSVMRPGQHAIPLAARIDVTGDRWLLSIDDAHGLELRIERAANRLTVNRHGGISPAFDAAIDADIGSGSPIRLWLDGTTLEIDPGNGTQWISVQHLLVRSTVQCALETHTAKRMTVATLPHR